MIFCTVKFSLRFLCFGYIESCFRNNEEQNNNRSNVKCILLVTEEVLIAIDIDFLIFSENVSFQFSGEKVYLILPLFFQHKWSSFILTSDYCVLGKVSSPSFVMITQSCWSNNVVMSACTWESKVSLEACEEGETAGSIYVKSLFFMITLPFLWLNSLINTGKMSTLELWNSEVSNVKDQSFTSSFWNCIKRHPGW